jgi:hypothetical protein
MHPLWGFFSFYTVQIHTPATWLGIDTFYILEFSLLKCSFPVPLKFSQKLLAHNVPSALPGLKTIHAFSVPNLDCNVTASHVWKLAFADWHRTYAFENLSPCKNDITGPLCRSRTRGIQLVKHSTGKVYLGWMHSSMSGLGFVHGPLTKRQNGGVLVAEKWQVFNLWPRVATMTQYMAF